MASGADLLALGLGAWPWLSLGLAFTFAFYGLHRKAHNLDAQTGLFVDTVDTLVMPPLAIGQLIWSGGLIPPGGSPPYGIVILSAGFIAVPMYLFNAAAARQPIRLGHYAYLSPTLQFLLATLNF